jgi:hypothetical protein
VGESAHDAPPLSLRVRNFESGKLKVNDHDGNPIEIAAVVVWRIVETFEAVFNVDDYEHFVHVQTEAAVRILATTYAYDSHDDGLCRCARRSGRSPIGFARGARRLAKAGIDVIEARISHLAYAPKSPARCCAASRPARSSRAPEDRRRRGRHGGDGAQEISRKAWCSSTKSARRRW